MSNLMMGQLETRETEKLAELGQNFNRIVAGSYTS